MTGRDTVEGEGRGAALPWSLRSVAVVLVLPQQQADTQTISPESLRRNKIVPASWEPNNVIALPVSP